jgi:hypothetical protein
MKRFLFFFYATWFLLALSANVWFFADLRARYIEQGNQCLSANMEISDRLRNLSTRLPTDVSKDVKDILYLITPAKEPEETI